MEETKQLPDLKDLKEQLHKENVKINNYEFFGGDVFNNKEVKAYLQGHRQYKDGYLYTYDEFGKIKDKQINWKTVNRSPNQIL